MKWRGSINNIFYNDLTEVNEYIKDITKYAENNPTEGRIERMSNNHLYCYAPNSLDGRISVGLLIDEDEDLDEELENSWTVGFEGYCEDLNEITEEIKILKTFSDANSSIENKSQTVRIVDHYYKLSVCSFKKYISVELIAKHNYSESHKNIEDSLAWEIEWNISLKNYNGDWMTLKEKELNHIRRIVDYVDRIAHTSIYDFACCLKFEKEYYYIVTVDILLQTIYITKKKEEE